MVVVVPSKLTQALYAVVAVTAVAMIVATGSPILLEHMAASSWPDWVYWVAAGFIVMGALPTYWAILPTGAAQMHYRRPK